MKTKQGAIQGIEENRVAKFLGIPYAEPPVGDLRWRPPVKHKPWRNVLQTTKFGPRCAQGGGAAGNTNEDCLHLNVFVPLNALKDAGNKHGRAGKGLPVMFWIFGGGLAIGSPDGYDGSALATQGQTIVVTVNYRLNIFGFLLNADLKHNGREYGNFGLLDQQLGMKWVQENIAKFGGDPNNITIFGESGGSHGVGGHLVSPYAKGLFQRAIQQSGTVDFVHSPYSQAVTRGKNFAKAVGCASGTAAENAKCLRSLPAATVQANAGAGGGALPLVDGEVIPIEPTIAFAKGRFNKVPIMTGGNRDEYAYVLSSRPTAPTETDFLNYLRNRFQVQGAGPGGLPPAYPANTVDRILA